MHDLNTVKKKRVLSLFSGCGGMDLGMEGGFSVHKLSAPGDKRFFIKKKNDPNNFVHLPKTGFETVFANDINANAKKLWSSYFDKQGKNTDTFALESIVELVKNHRGGLSVFPSDIDVVTGGFPCQDFSLAGKRNGFQSHKDHAGNIIQMSRASVETRGTLYMWMKEVIELTLPKIFIAENVKGLTNLANVKDIIRQDFAAMENGGYHVFEPQVLQAADYGVPQSRERVFFVGVRKSCLQPHIAKLLAEKELPSELSPYPKASHAYTIKNPALKPYVRVGEVLNYLHEPETSLDLGHRHFSRAKYMGKHCQGQTEVNIHGLAPTIRSEHHGNIEFRRLSRDHGGKYTREMDMNGFKERRLTPRECALIQTFPPDFPLVIPGIGKRFFVSPSAAYKAVGNAVPPLLAYHFALRMEEIWSDYFG